MNLRRIIAASVLIDALFFGVASAGLLPSFVTDTVSGSPGDYTYDFTLTNNFPAGNGVYFLGVQLGQTNVTGSPPGWAPFAQNTPWNPALDGGAGPNASFDNTWNLPYGGLPAGSVLSGFEVTVNSATINTDVAWMVYAFGGTDPNRDGHFGPDYNPGFSSLVQGVPEPATWAMMLVGFGGLGAAMRLRRRLAAADA